MTHYSKYRRNYTSRDRSWAAIEHVRQYQELSARLGPIIDDIKQAFFDLSSGDLEKLLKSYAEQHGTKAADYARDAMPRWKSGKTKMSGQTAERLLNLVPKYLTFDQRYTIVKKLCRHHAPRKHRHISINIKDPAEGFTQLRGILGEFQDNSLLKYLPDHVLKVAVWLNDDDMVASRALLAELNRKENEMVRQIADQESRDLATLVSNGVVKSSSKSIEFPNGSVSVTLYDPRMCFIATACFGDVDSEPVAYLRRFRDIVLKPNPYGARFIHWYYLHGPTLAYLISTHPSAKVIIRTSLRYFTFMLKQIAPL